MISYVTGSLFESPAQTLVNTVNVVGVMGRGIAKTFKAVYPAMFQEYQQFCETDRLTIGKLHLYRTPNKLVLNFPTKQHWRSPSRPEYIEAGLKTFVKIYQRAGIHSVAFPPLGCGNGELDFGRTVLPIMERHLSQLRIPVFIYAPHKRTEPPEHRIPKETRDWLRSEPRDLAFSEVWTDLLELLGKQHTFRTLARGTPVEGIANPNLPGIRVRAAGKTTTFEKEEVFELWKELRSFGVFTSRSATRKREKDVAYIMPLFAALPYVHVVQVSGDYESFNRSPNLALQLAPAPPAEARDQLALI